MWIDQITGLRGSHLRKKCVLRANLRSVHWEQFASSWENNQGTKSNKQGNQLPLFAMPSVIPRSQVEQTPGSLIIPRTKRLAAASTGIAPLLTTEQRRYQRDRKLSSTPSKKWALTPFGSPLDVRREEQHGDSVELIWMKKAGCDSEDRRERHHWHQHEWGWAGSAAVLHCSRIFSFGRENYIEEKKEK